ncbi:MAG: hypothetical protein ACXAEI_07550 [Candidatus Hodarchaeales archaeon]|jgi:surface polysaccharide O-acyltransferase-like enzyme
MASPPLKNRTIKATWAATKARRKTQVCRDDAGLSDRSVVYTVYIIHQTIVIILHILLLDVNIPTILKFFIVGVIAVPLCFLLSMLIRRIPGARRVLG